MLETVISVKLPVDEVLTIKKVVLKPSFLSGQEKRFCIVSGIHGDELEGQYVCYELIRKIKENIDCLKGVVELYPAANPLGMEAISRGVPAFDLDMNKSFPGHKDGDLVERAAAGISEAVKGASLCIDLHASNIFIREIPQVRLGDQNFDLLFDYAKELNVEFIWADGSPTVLESTLAHTLNAMGVPTLAVEMGVGMRITKEYGDHLVDGIFCLMKKLGIWEGNTIKPRKPIVSTDGEVEMVHAKEAGIFLPRIEHWKGIKQGDVVGEIVNSLEGTVLEQVKAPCSGMVFTLREFPIVYEGSLIARILGGIG